MLLPYFLTGALDGHKIPEIPGTEGMVDKGLQFFWHDKEDLGLGKGESE